MSDKKNETKQKQPLSAASKAGFIVLILLLAGVGLYVGMELAGRPEMLDTGQGARFEDLPEDLRTRISGLAAASKEKPSDLTIRSHFCHALLEGKLLEDAQNCYEDLGKVVGGSPDALTHLGEIAFYRGDLDKAESYYERAIGIEPEYPHAYFNLGYLKMTGTKDYKGAREAYQKFIDLDPESEIKFQVKYIILQLNDIIGDRPGVPQESRQLVINPEKLQEQMQ